MTVTLDFGALPPEINSARMYAGPGSGSMITAAASWEGLAADLRSQAASYSSVVSGLTSDGWRGPASASMAAAAAPYAAWMNTTAAQAEQAANQAKAAAAAYEAAFSATVPPPVIAANRAQLASLVATNFLGQNTPAIAATEVHYAEMWAQDAAAMYGYAGSSAAATQLTPLTGPTQNTNAGALAGQSAAVAPGHCRPGWHGQPVAVAAGHHRAKHVAGIGVPRIVDVVFGDVIDLGARWHLESADWGVLREFRAGQLLERVGAQRKHLEHHIFFGVLHAEQHLGCLHELARRPSSWCGRRRRRSGCERRARCRRAAGGLAGPLGGLGGLGGLGSGVSAGLGKAASLGPLSVPSSWTAIAPTASPIASALGGTPLAGPPAVAAGVPGVPLAGAPGRGAAGVAGMDNRFLAPAPHGAALGGGRLTEREDRQFISARSIGLANTITVSDKERFR